MVIMLDRQNLRMKGGKNVGYAVDQKQIRRIVAENDLKPKNLAKALNISVKSVHNKLQDPSGRLWKGHELAVLADVAMVEPGSFFHQNSA